MNPIYTNKTQFQKLKSLNGVFTDEALDDEIIIDVERAGLEEVEQILERTITDTDPFIRVITP